MSQSQVPQQVLVQNQTVSNYLNVKYMNFHSFQWFSLKIPKKLIIFKSIFSFNRFNEIHLQKSNKNQLKQLLNNKTL